MAEDDMGDSRPPAPMEPQGNGRDMGSDGSDAHSSYPPSLGPENGINGISGTSEDDSMDEYQDAPLDFSIKPPQKNGHSRHVRDEYEKLAERHEYESMIKREPDGDMGYGHVPQQTRESESSQHVDIPKYTSSLSPVSPYSTEGSSHSEDIGDKKIGEPQTALPGMLPGTLLPGTSTMSSFPVFPPGLLPNAALLNAGLSFPFQDAKTPAKQEEHSPGKSPRPFKAYPKEPLSLPLAQPTSAALTGIPPITELDVATAKAMALNSEELFQRYRDYVVRTQEQNRRSRNNKQPKSPSNSPSVFPQMNKSPPGPPAQSPMCPPPTDKPALPNGSSLNGSRKRGRQIPDTNKDAAYWERRRKNNEAAKRSRDSRRAKEDEIAIRAAFLEQENLKLRVEVAALKNETAKLRCMLYNS